MKCISKTSEDKIREAAKQVFLKKGFDGTTSRDIADAADTNIALTNYYFRSKEKLFLEIFRDMIELYFQETIDIFNKSISLKEKIIEVVNHQFDMMKREPDLVIFVMSEVHKEPRRLLPLHKMRRIKATKFNDQLTEMVKEGTLRPIEIDSILPLITCGIQFVFLGKNIHQEVFEKSEEQFMVFAEEFKNTVLDMVLSYLFWKK
ncbi:hypothetical protein DYBT9275_01345 [Dyadobacter sp. CECT 9275]|uniref:HTH tetR-type domain-containing protein n=1 Tax=Dyadobacter helix TaxID=2822344 RepID=A0A916N3A9_9BACT|nr:TetR/AcrR family transcriptional regulator [Dyadobacter sp. CECT 9275]CAG4994210.1 hypothetical protein DYBT9275_01345 [Dyadobacter sp. CECT 9275]